MEKNLINLLTTLRTGETYLYPISEYNRIGELVVDNFNMFNEEKTSLSKFELVLNDERINISVREKINGIVKLNPKTAKRLGLPSQIKSTSYKTKTLIRDGELNVKSIRVVTDTNTYFKIKNIFEIKEFENKTTHAGYSLEIKLDNMPIFPIISTSINEIEENYLKMFELKTKQSVLNNLLKQLPAIQKEKIFNDEQLQFLNDYGLDENFNYIGIDPETKSEETYVTKVVNFKVAGLGTAPKLSEVLDRIANGKKLNYGGKIIEKYYNETLKDILPITNDEIKRNIFENLLFNIKNDIYNTKFELLLSKTMLLKNAEVAISSTQGSNFTISIDDKEFKK